MSVPVPGLAASQAAAAPTGPATTALSSDRAPVRAPARERLNAVGEWAAWVVPLGLYVGLIIPTAIQTRELLSPDAVAYIRRAVYLTQGHWSASVSGYWSPLLSWSIAPFVAAGVDPVYAARFALGVWGALFVVAAHLFLRALTPWDWVARIGVLCVLAVVAVHRAAEHITPDLLLATCLLAYFAAATSPRLCASRRWQLLTGLLAGVAYLAKSYALPFVAIHLPFTIAMHLLAERVAAASPAGGRRVGRALRSAASTWLVTMAGLALVAGPWVAVLSAKYGRVTTSTSAAVARSIVGPKVVSDAAAGYEARLRAVTPPPDPFIAETENPDGKAFRSWSPFDSRELMLHQLSLIRDHAARAAQYVGSWDVAKVGWLALGLGLVAATGWLRVPEFDRWRAAWLTGTALLYCAGFLLVWLIPRYIDTLVLPLVLTLAVWLVHGLVRPRTPSSRSPWPHVARVAVALGVLASFAWPAVADVRELHQNQKAHIYREVATRLRELGVAGPIACTHRQAGMYLALHTGLKLQSIVYLDTKQPEAQKVEAALLAGRPGAIVLWAERRNDSPQYADARRYAGRLVRRLGWERRIHEVKWGRTIDVYTPRPDDPDPYQVVELQPTTRKASKRRGQK